MCVAQSHADAFLTIDVAISQEAPMYSCIFDFTSNGGASTVAEIVYDVTITLDAQRAEGSGVYTDTIIFTIMDDG